MIFNLKTVVKGLFNNIFYLRTIVKGRFKNYFYLRTVVKYPFNNGCLLRTIVKYLPKMILTTIVYIFFLTLPFNNGWRTVVKGL
jgi:hypothetical protein